MQPDNLSQLMLMLGEMKGGISAGHEKMDVILSKLSEYEKRTNSLEHWRTGLMARVGLVVVIIGGVWEIILKKTGII